MECPTRDEAGELAGVVTYHHPSEAYVFLEDDAGGAWRVEAEALQAVTAVKPGDRIRASGIFPHHSTTPRMNHAVVEVVGRGDVPAPLVKTPEELYAPDPDGEAGRRAWYGRLVATSGVVRDINRRETYTQLLLGPKAASVIVSVPVGFNEPLPGDLVIGARVRVTGVGVYTAERDGRTNTARPIRDVSVRLRGLEGLEVVDAPPFWTPARAGALAAVVLAVLAGMGVWVLMLRRAVARAARHIEAATRHRVAAEATARERLRLSHDLHDGFQQLLASCSFRLAAATNYLRSGAPREEILARLGAVEDALQHTQTGLRAALWSISEEAEGPSRFSDLIRYAAGRLAHWEGVVSFRFAGAETPMARRHAGALLMVLQEAVANAIRHGGAAHVRVTVAFGERTLEMRIEDDGRGFDPEDEAVRAPGHMGLAGMRSRVSNLGGTFEITSVRWPEGAGASAGAGAGNETSTSNQHPHGTTILIRMPV